MNKKGFESFLLEYNNPTDEEIVALANQGNKMATNFLLDKYSSFVNKKASNYFMVGSEHDDLIQEGYIGLYKAIKSYDQEKENSFKTFATLCVERQMITAIKTSNRQKHMPLNQSLSLNGSSLDENNELSLIDILDDKFVEDPLDTITKKEEFSNLQKKIEDNLSEFEKKVINLHVQGLSYADIATELKTTSKGVDNAIQRIRRKATKVVSDED